MQVEWLIIDGYNLLHQVDDLVQLLQSDMASARHRLVRLIENTAHRMAPQTTLVFDGREAGQDDALTSKHMEVYFSPGKFTADTIIERLVCRFPNPEKILVVTSDHAEHDTVSGAGAQVISSKEFMAQCKINNQKSIPKQTPPGKKPKLGDLFPDGF